MSGVHKLFLVGYMGCGKTTLGRRLSRRLGWRLVDTDSEIELREGASVSDIFRFEGEEHFRHLERDLIEELAQSGEPLIISTGGGLPIWGDNMARLNELGLTVYLKRSAQNIASRLSPYGRQRRPKLRGLSDSELIEFMDRNIRERAPRYEKARLILDAEWMTDDELVNQVVSYMNDNE